MTEKDLEELAVVEVLFTTNLVPVDIAYTLIIFLIFVVILLLYKLICRQSVLALPLKPLLGDQARVADPLALLGHFREVQLVRKSIGQLVV